MSNTHTLLLKTHIHAQINYSALLTQKRKRKRKNFNFLQVNSSSSISLSDWLDDNFAKTKKVSKCVAVCIECANGAVIVIIHQLHFIQTTTELALALFRGNVLSKKVKNLGETDYGIAGRGRKKQRINWNWAAIDRWKDRRCKGNNKRKNLSAKVLPYCRRLQQPNGEKTEPN